MTNAEKFEEVFGIKIDDEGYPSGICQSIDHKICEEHNCPDCPAFKFWDQEYKEEREDRWMIEIKEPIDKLMKDKSLDNWMDLIKFILNSDNMEIISREELKQSEEEDE